MSKYQANLSHDGYVYTKKDGLVGGLKTFGVIQPESNIRAGGGDNVWEAIVIGAGYAGLIAARDLVKAGKSNLGRVDKLLKLARQENSPAGGSRSCGRADMECRS